MVDNTPRAAHPQTAILLPICILLRWYNPTGYTQKPAIIHSPCGKPQRQIPANSSFIIPGLPGKTPAIPVLCPAAPPPKNWAIVTEITLFLPSKFNF